MDAFFKLVAAGPLFFVSAWLLMIFAGITASDVGIRPFGYVTSMLAAIGAAPTATTGSRTCWGWTCTAPTRSSRTISTFTWATRSPWDRAGPGSLVMERKMLLGIQQRAEGR